MSNENNEQKVSAGKRVKTFFMKECPAEKYVVLVLGLILLAGGIALGMGRLEVREWIDWFGPNTQSIFMWGLVFIGLLAIMIAFWDQIVDSAKEMKKVTPPTSKIMVELSIKVLIFISLVTLFLFVTDLLMSGVVPFIKGLIE